MNNAEIFAISKAEIEKFIEAGDLDPNKILENYSSAKGKDFKYTFHVGECTFIIRLYEIKEDEENISFIFVEMGLGMVDVNYSSHIFQHLLDWNRKEPSPLKAGLANQGICLLSYRQRLNSIDISEMYSNIVMLMRKGEDLHKEILELGGVTLADGWKKDKAESEATSLN